MENRLMYVFLFFLLSCNEPVELEKTIKDAQQVYIHNGSFFCIVLDRNEGLYYLKQYDKSKLFIAESRIKNSIVIPVIDTIYYKTIIIRYDDISGTNPYNQPLVQFDTLKNNPDQWPEYFVHNGNYEIIYKYTTNKGKQLIF